MSGYGVRAAADYNLPDDPADASVKELVKKHEGYVDAATPSGGYGGSVPVATGTEVKNAAPYGIPAGTGSEVKNAADYGIPAGTGSEVKNAADYGIPAAASTEVKHAADYVLPPVETKDAADYVLPPVETKDADDPAAKDDETKDKDSEAKPTDDEPVDDENPLTLWIKEVYEKLDKDGNGQVTKAEMKEALQKDSIKNVFSRCGVEDEEAAMELLLKADKGGNDDGEMSFDEFEKVFVLAIFKAVDKDGSGGIDRKELQDYYHRILNKQRPEKTSAQNRKTAWRFATRKVTGKYDDSKDGVLQFEEFHEMMKLSTMLKPDVK